MDHDNRSDSSNRQQNEQASSLPASSEISGRAGQAFDSGPQPGEPPHPTGPYREVAEFEDDLAHALTEGDMQAEEPDDAALRRLGERYEIRIQAEQDPIVEETRLYRRIASEVDSRYDDYLKRIHAEGEHESPPEDREKPV